METLFGINGPGNLLITSGFPTQRASNTEVMVSLSSAWIIFSKKQSNGWWIEMPRNWWDWSHCNDSFNCSLFCLCCESNVHKFYLQIYAQRTESSLVQRNANQNEIILIKRSAFKMMSAKWWPFYLGLNRSNSKASTTIVSDMNSFKLTHCGLMKP